MTKQWHVLIVHRMNHVIVAGSARFHSLARPLLQYATAFLVSAHFLKVLMLAPWFMLDERFVRSITRSSTFEKEKKKIVRSKLEFRFFNRNGDRFVFMRWARNIFNPWWYNARKICESRDPLLPHSLRLYNARGESFNVWRNFVQTPARETRKACLGAYRTEKVEKRVARY